MNSHDITVAGFLAILAAGIGAGLAAQAKRAPIPAFAQLFTRIMRTRTGRVGILIGWAWIGLHFFAR